MLNRKSNEVPARARVGTRHITPARSAPTNRTFRTCMRASLPSRIDVHHHNSKRDAMRVIFKGNGEKRREIRCLVPVRSPWRGISKALQRSGVSYQGDAGKIQSRAPGWPALHHSIGGSIAQA